MTHMTYIRLGTRTSPLAMVQAEMVKARLESSCDSLTVDIIPISTSGDIHKDARLADIGGKGLFTKELDIAIADGRCDIAVHSLKDVETILPDGMTLACVLNREDVRDVFISADGTHLHDMKYGAIIGTASLRRQAQLLKLRPDFKVVLFRGNVATRLQKLQDGVVDATLLALAGLKRLGKEQSATQILPRDTFIPAVGQGAIAVQCRDDNKDIIDLLQVLNCENTNICVSCERAMLFALDGTCKTPVGGYAKITGDTITLDGFASTDDGKTYERITRTADIKNALDLGREVGLELRQKMGTEFDKMVGHND